MKARLLDSVCVVSNDGCTANLETALARDLPRCEPTPAHGRALAVIGGGPSVRWHIEELRAWSGDLWAVNGVYEYLLDEGVVPTGFIGVDPLPGLAEYVKRAHPDTTFLMSGLCDPSVFDRLKGHQVSLWFPEQSGMKFPGGLWIVNGGTTGLTRTPFLARMLGYRDITIFGADSSFDEDSRYCYKYGSFAEDSKAKVIFAEIEGEGIFPTEIALAKQVAQFWAIKQSLGDELKFKCGGLLAAFLRSPTMDDSLIELEDARTDAA